jgi:hypothetical protein
MRALLFLRLTLCRLSEAHSGPSSVFIDELDAGVCSVLMRFCENTRIFRDPALERASVVAVW